MTIKLENFTATIDVESVELESVHDVTKEQIATVNVLINSKYVATLNGYTYSKTWSDSEALEWANKELIKYQIK